MLRGLSVSLLCGALALALGVPATAQIEKAAPATAATTAAPDYFSGTESGTLADGNFNTPEADGRPALYFFTLGGQAFRKGDYQHAIDMYKIAASWAYKPAEYNLGLMYFRGEGVSVDRARGAAWMTLAAERNTPSYVRARDLMVTALSDSEFARTDELWGQLKETYGDKVALRRAKSQWAWARSHETGTRVGGTAGVLHVGAYDKPNFNGGNPSGHAQGLMQGWGFFAGGSTDGAIAYRQFEQSSDPYDPIFLKDRTGTATIGPLAPVKAAQTPASAPAATDGGSQHF